jgi:Cu2+-containing amine oxidase
MTATLSFMTSEVAPAVAAISDAPHSLDSLSAAEIVLAVRILRTELPLTAGARLEGVTRHEPPQAAGGARPSGNAVDRDVRLIVFDPQLEATYEAVVAVDDGFVRSFRWILGVQPADRWGEPGPSERDVMT